MASDWSWQPDGHPQQKNRGRKKRAKRVRCGFSLRGMTGKDRGIAMLQKFMPVFRAADLAAQGRMPYKDYLLTPYWRAVRKVALAFGGYCCARCHRKGALQIHHKTYQWRGQEHMHIECLEPLCDDCHNAEHGIVALPSAVDGVPTAETKAKHGLTETELAELMARSTRDLIETVCSKGMAKRRQVRFIVAIELKRRLADLEARLATFTDAGSKAG